MGSPKAARTREPRRGRQLARPILIFAAEEPDTPILDPFVASGSIGLAAKLEGRSFIGFEIDKEMAAIANKRIQDQL